MDSTEHELSPLSLDEFFSEYWEKSPLHINRKTTNPYVHCISAEALQNILSTHPLQYPQVQLSKTGSSLPSNLYTDENGVIAPARIADYYNDGATIILSHAQHLHPPLLDLCRRMQKLLFMPCQTNIYYSPAGKQGFNPHYDTHDVFILQVSGKKCFRFYSERTLFPTTHHQFNKEVHAVGRETETISLSPGDLLYIPRGIVHDAVADSNHPSLHITLGVYPILNRDLLHELIDIASENDHQLRQAIPQLLWTGHDQSPDRYESIHTLFGRCFNADHLHHALDKIRDRIALDTLPNISKMFDGQGIELATHFQVRHDRIMHVENDDSTTKMRLFGAVIEFEPALSAEIKWVLSQNEFNKTDIQPNQQEAVLSVLSQLRQYGVVEFVL